MIPTVFWQLKIAITWNQIWYGTATVRGIPALAHLRWSLRRRLVKLEAHYQRGKSWAPRAGIFLPVELFWNQRAHQLQADNWTFVLSMCSPCSKPVKQDCDPLRAIATVDADLRIEWAWPTVKDGAGLGIDFAQPMATDGRVDLAIRREHSEWYTLGEWQAGAAGSRYPSCYRKLLKVSEWSRISSQQTAHLKVLAQAVPAAE